MRTSARSSTSSKQVNGGATTPHNLLLPAGLLQLRHNWLAGSSTHGCLLSAEISLDVDADRDGEVEKNNPKKVSWL